MKRKILIISIFVFLFTIRAYAISIPETIRIGLFYGSTAKSSVTIICNNEQFDINSEDFTEKTVFESDGIISVNNAKYRGNIEVSKNSNGLLQIVNIVDLEDYLKSVVGKEMSASFHEEALKVQAICARTYAISNLNKHSKYGFDLCASVDCQAYGGLASEAEKVTKAVKDTDGMVITYKGKLINALYSATSGGHTENAEDVFGTAFPYLVGVSDEYESKDVYGASWKKVYTAKELTEFCNNRGYNIGNVLNVEVISHTDSYAVTKLKITGDKGTKTFTNYACQSAFGADKLISQAYTITVTSEESKDSSSVDFETTNGKIEDDFYIISASGKVKFSGGVLTLLGSDNNSKTLEAKSEENSANKIYTFKGHGYGHLVGMSQNGANGMAKAGFKCDEIIKHYYQGTEIQ